MTDPLPPDPLPDPPVEPGPEPEPTTTDTPRDYQGPTGPTLCADDSYYSNHAPDDTPCPQCGHYLYSGHQHRPCDACRLEKRMQVLETMLGVQG